MIATETRLKGCFILEPNVFEDQRGYFFETFNQKQFKELIGTDVNFVQDNESYSKKGVLRGLHYQTGTFAQAKLVRVIEGCVLDLIIDIREGSETYGEQFSIELSDANKKQLYFPKGFAHGFIVLSDFAVFSYKCDNYYNKASEGGIIYNDKTLKVDWRLPEEQFIISEKDLELPTFENSKR